MLNTLTLQHFKGDLLGGATAAVVSLPLALAFGVASGAGPEAGLYGAMLIGLFTCLFGGTKTLISEPTGPMTVIMAAVITAMLAANPENGLAMAFTVVILAGLFQICFGLLKLGRYITLMPYSVVSGFMTGIGCILIVLQLAPLLGHAAPAGGVLGSLQAIPELFGNIQWTELAIGAAALVILFFTPKKVKQYLPAQLIALILVTAACYMLFEADAIRRIGEVSVSLPELRLPYFTADQIQTMLLDALILGMLGCIDSMLTSVIADNLTNTEHDSDKELIGQGIGNMVSGLFGGLPGAGATMGTVVNIQAGGRTYLSGVLRVVILAIALFGASGILENIPMAVLAAIAIKVGVDILDWSFIKRAHRVSWQSTLVMYSVMVLTVLVDLMVAVGVGIFIANIIIIEKLSRTQEKNVKSISDLDDRIQMSKEERALLNEAKGQVLLVYLSGPMIFGVARALSRQHGQIANHQVVILDLTDVSMLDDTIALSIENTIAHAAQLGKKVLLVMQTQAAKEKLSRMGALDPIGSEDIVDTRVQALQAANAALLN